MGKHWSTVCALIAAFCALAHFGKVSSAARAVHTLIDPEDCPWRLNLALSKKGCKDCPTEHICCIYNGEDVCVPPVSSKPGVCPRRHWDGILCFELCSYDSECPKNKKCCSTRCGRMCMAPVTVKPGVCPRRPLDNKDCVKSCSNDGDCPENEKCCSTECGRMCTEPHVV